MPEIAPSASDCFIQQIVKDKENAQKFPSASPQLTNRFCVENANQSNSEYGHFSRSEIAEHKQQKRLHFYQEVFYKCFTVNEISAYKEIKHT